MKTLFFIITLCVMSACSWDGKSYLDNYLELWDITDTTTSEELLAPCEELIHLTDTGFLCLSAAFDHPLMNPTFKLYNKEIYYTTLTELLDTHFGGYDYYIYADSLGICVFIENAQITEVFNGKIVVTDDINGRTALTAYKNAIVTYGSLTFLQQLYEHTHRLNIETIVFFGTTFTLNQNNLLARRAAHFDLCKHGERIFDFDGVPIQQSIIDSLELYLWQRVDPFYDPDEIKS